VSIETEDLHVLLSSWFNAVRDGIASEDALAGHFVDPQGQAVAPDGTCFKAADQRKLHQRFLNEKHTIGEFEIVQISNNPERARAKGWVYFETQYRDHPERGFLKSVVGEEYIVERCADGRLRFVQYNSVFFAPLPDSIPFDIS